ncbi:MAG: SAVED domain-containing protein [Desulfovibrionaceae bacterium]
MKIFKTIWNGITWLFTMWLKYRSMDPGLRAANGVFWAGTLGAGGTGFCLKADLKLPVLSSVTASWGDQAPLWMSISLMAVGIVCFILRIKHCEKKWLTALVYVRGLSRMAEAPPKDDLPSKYTLGRVIPFSYPIIDRATPEERLDELKQIERDLKHRISSEEQSPRHVLFAGLGDVPLLYAAGCLLGTRKGLEVMDYDRNVLKWSTLDECDNGKRIEIVKPKELKEDLAIVIPFTIPINDEQIPEHLRGCIARVEPQWNIKTDAVLCERQLAEITAAINDYIRDVRRKIERVHLFLATGASSAFKLGMYYQENAYPETFVYQYDSKTNQYVWAVRVDKGRQEIVQG